MESDATAPRDGASGDAGVDGATVPTEECPGTELSTDGALSLDVPAVLVEGEVTLNGGALPEGMPRGAIAIRGDAGEIVIDLGTSGAGRYRALLVPGDYELRYVAAGCEPGSRLPCGGGLITTSALRSDGVLDLDLRSVTVRGTVQIDGREVPADGAALRFGDEASVSWDSTGAYEVRLIPGTYRIDLVPGARACGDAGDDLPCTGGTLREVSLASDGVLDLDVATVQIQGRVTANGGAPRVPGALSFEGGGGSAVTPFDATGAYLVRLLPGSYDVRFDGSGLACAAADTELPCNGGVVREALSLTTSGVLDLDVPSVLVTGRVRVDGAPPATAGMLGFGEAGVPFDATGDYRARLLRGTYDVTYAGAGCAGLADMPCNGGIVSSDVALVADGVLDVAIDTITVQGLVTVSGATPLEAGTLTFEGEGELGDASTAYEPDGTYALTLMRGRYDVSFAPADPSCPEDATLPCHRAQILTGIELATDGVVDVDVPVVTITGSVSPDGAARFLRDGAELVAAPRTAVYEVRLAPGTWNVDFVDSSCPPSGTAPCVSARAHTALELTADGVLDVEVPVVRVAASVTVNGETLARDASASVSFVKLATVADPAADELPWDVAEARLARGLYLVTYDGGTSGCDAADRRWPCLSRVLSGCVEER